MPELFKRRAKLTIGEPGQPDPPSWEGLRIVFNINKTLSSEPNQSAISIYNLNRDSRSRIFRRRDAVQLEVAYGDEPLETLFGGEIRFINHQRESGDIATKIESGAGDSAWSVTRIKESLGANTTIQEVFNRLKRAFTESLQGLGASVDGSFDQMVSQVADTATANRDAEPSTSIGSGIYAAGIVLNDKIGKLLARLSESAGADFFIDNNIMYGVKKDGFLPLPAVLVSSLTGMIGSPVILEEGIRVRSLIIPGLLPGRELAVESRGFTGSGNLVEIRGWKITSVRFSGDTHGPQWEADIVAEETANVYVYGERSA